MKVWIQLEYKSAIRSGKCSNNFNFSWSNEWYNGIVQMEASHFFVRYSIVFKNRHRTYSECAEGNRNKTEERNNAESNDLASFLHQKWILAWGELHWKLRSGTRDDRFEKRTVLFSRCASVRVTLHLNKGIFRFESEICREDKRPSPHWKLDI